jgi:hypothetical protein
MRDKTRTHNKERDSRFNTIPSPRANAERIGKEITIFDIIFLE